MSERWKSYAEWEMRAFARRIEKFRQDRHQFGEPQPLPYQEARNLRVQAEMLLDELNEEIARQDNPNG